MAVSVATTPLQTGLHLSVSGEEAIADAVHRAMHPAGLPRTD